MNKWLSKVAGQKTKKQKKTKQQSTKLINTKCRLSKNFIHIHQISAKDTKSLELTTVKFQAFNWVHRWTTGDQYSDKGGATDNYNVVWDFWECSIFSTTVLDMTTNYRLTPKTLCYRMNKQHGLMIAWIELDWNEPDGIELDGIGCGFKHSCSGRGLIKIWHFRCSFTFEWLVWSAP